MRFCYRGNFNPFNFPAIRLYDAGRTRVGLCPKFLVYNIIRGQSNSTIQSVASIYNHYHILSGSHARPVISSRVKIITWLLKATLMMKGKC